jgi:opacity protein-like surface antigen
MKESKTLAVAAMVALSTLPFASSAFAQEDLSSPSEFSVMGGLEVLNRNDTGVPDRFVNVPFVATVGVRLNSAFAAEGEFTWMIPVKQDVDVGTGGKVERMSPDIMAYQANLRANLPASPAWSPYVVGGVGALTVASTLDADRAPRLDASQTMFALNFGAGLTYRLTADWVVRSDFREFTAFPADHANGLSNSGRADPIWMERAAVGVGYRF